MNRVSERGSAKTWLIVSIVTITTTLILAGVAVWALINYFDQKDNVDTKVSAAVAEARKEQADADEAKFLEREKDPNRQFVGPEDYGRVSFDYPKTWSVYVAEDASAGGSFEAYLNPVAVPPIANDTQLALRVTIETGDYDREISSYSRAVNSGDLTSSSITLDGVTGTRLDGNFSDDIRGSAVIFRIRDKVVTLRTDAQTFRADFDKLIQTVTFNK